MRARRRPRIPDQSRGVALGTAATWCTASPALAAAGWKLEQVTTDNGSEFRVKAFGATVECLGASAGSAARGPNSNGWVERVQLTILEDLLAPTPRLID